MFSLVKFNNVQIQGENNFKDLISETLILFFQKITL